MSTQYLIDLKQIKDGDKVKKVVAEFDQLQQKVQTLDQAGDLSGISQKVTTAEQKNQEQDQSIEQINSKLQTIEGYNLETKLRELTEKDSTIESTITQKVQELTQKIETADRTIVGEVITQMTDPETSASFKTLKQITTDLKGNEASINQILSGLNTNNEADKRLKAEVEKINTTIASSLLKDNVKTVDTLKFDIPEGALLIERSVNGVDYKHITSQEQMPFQVDSSDIVKTVYIEKIAIATE